MSSASADSFCRNHDILSWSPYNILIMISCCLVCLGLAFGLDTSRSSNMSFIASSFFLAVHSALSFSGYLGVGSRHQHQDLHILNHLKRLISGSCWSSSLPPSWTPAPALGHTPLWECCSDFQSWNLRTMESSGWQANCLSRLCNHWSKHVTWIGSWWIDPIILYWVFDDWLEDVVLIE